MQEAQQTYWAGQAEIQHRVVAAWLARAEGKTQEALDHMRAAADLEDATDWRQGVVFTRNAFTIDTVPMRMYAPIIPGKTQFGHNFG
jgi:hypothetical protein